MKPRRSSVNSRRIVRLTRWTMLWLQGSAAALLFFMQRDPAALRRKLNRLSLHAGVLVFLHVARRVRPPQHKTLRKPVDRPSFIRTVIGSRLRKDLRRRDPVAHFFAILEVMRDLEIHVARLAKRLANGLTRERPIQPVRERDVLALALDAPVLAGADTS